jgi:hypothetical protein
MVKIEFMNVQSIRKSILCTCVVVALKTIRVKKPGVGADVFRITR